MEEFFRPALAGRSGVLVLVAFSGGPDSTALVAGLTRVAPELGIAVDAAHVDHGLDPDSPRRAREARRLPQALGVPLRSQRLPDPGGEVGLAGESREAWARRQRYRCLERLADECGASFIATAHHADDQAETVLLRLLFGSGIRGLAGIWPRCGRLVRPLLALRRSQLVASLEGSGPEPVADPTNLDLTVPRNRIRHQLLPRLEAGDPQIVARLGRLAAAAGRAAGRCDERLQAHLRLRPVPPAVAIDRPRFEALAASLRPLALALVHRTAGAPYPPAAAARRELLRQLARGRGGCDCGDGWRWEFDPETVYLVAGESAVGEFAYNLEAPGEVEISELALRFRLGRVPFAAWMLEGRSDRAALAPRWSTQSRIEVRNRRPGDRLRPLGAGGRRRLKDLLRERRIPRWQRDRLPLLVVDGEIAWVPGVTIDERYRLHPGDCGSPVWVAAIDAVSPSGGMPEASASLPGSSARSRSADRSSQRGPTAGASAER